MQAGINSGAQEGQTVPAPQVAPVVLLLSQTPWSVIFGDERMNEGRTGSDDVKRNMSVMISLHRYSLVVILVMMVTKKLSKRWLQRDYYICRWKSRSCLEWKVLTNIMKRCQCFNDLLKLSNLGLTVVQSGCD